MGCSALLQALDRIGTVEVPPGHLRLYRIEPAQPRALAEWLQEALHADGTLAAQGRWFTQDPNALGFYAQDQEHVASVVRWMDAPADLAGQWKVSQLPRTDDGLSPLRFSRDPENEFFVSVHAAEQSHREPLPIPSQRRAFRP